MGKMKIWDWVAIVLLLVGGLNWGLVGLFNFDLVTQIFGFGSTLTKIVYVLVGISAVYSIFALSKIKK